LLNLSLSRLLVTWADFFQITLLLVSQGPLPSHSPLIVPIVITH
jgi:hypothetical protein